MKTVMDITDAGNVIKDLREKPFICSQYTIETESGYVITTKSKRPYCKPMKHTNADRIRTMSDEELAEFIKHISHNCLMNTLFSVNDEDCKHYEDCESCREAHETVKEWLQSEAE